jgi:hypothetical protein
MSSKLRTVVAASYRLMSNNAAATPYTVMKLYPSVQLRR